MTSLKDITSWPIFVQGEKFILVRIQKNGRAPSYEVRHNGERICNFSDMAKAQAFARKYLLKLRKQ